MPSIIRDCNVSRISRSRSSLPSVLERMTV